MFIGKTYEEIYKNFKWELPTEYNIGVDICDKWAQEKHRLALIYLDEHRREQKITYWELKNKSNCLANALRAHGLERGDRVGVLLPPTPETLFTHLAVYKSGAILVPLLQLFGPLAVEYRLQNSGAKMLVTDMNNLSKVLEGREKLPHLEKIIVIDAPEKNGILNFHSLLANGSRYFDPVRTLAENPAVIIYTSGTTGPPKGTLHSHRILLSEVVNLSFALNFFPQKGDVLWTHCDWAYMAGSFCALYPCLHNGLTMVESRRTSRFDPNEAFQVISKYGVSVIFAISTAVRMMRKEVEEPREKFDLDELRSITIGGETMGQDLYEWGRNSLKIEINENYGLTECDFTVSNCSAVMDVFPGSMGRAIPGHIVEIIDDAGKVLDPNEYGEIAIKAPDPSLFLCYWKNEEATKKRYIGEWFRTGDYGTKDKNGYFWFIGREDDVIKTGGYRVGPGEVEDALKKHESVAMAAVIGVPHQVRGEAVKAFIILKNGFCATPELKKSIMEHIRKKLEAHAYPKEIEFVPELPLGNTGKVLKRELKKMAREKRS